MAISIRLTDEDTVLIKKYAQLHNVSVSDLFREAVMEKIEEEYDLSLFEKAMEDFASDNTTYTLAEVEKILGLE